MNLKKLFVASVLVLALILSFIPLATADEEFKDFYLGMLNRLSELSWQDVENSHHHENEAGSSWNGLTIEIFLASRTLFIEVENEPAEEFELVIIGNHAQDASAAWEAGAVTYKRDDVYEEGVITINLPTNPGWQALKNDGRPGFRIILSGSGWSGVGEIFGVLEYSPSDINSFRLWKFNTLFNESMNQMGFSDQERADWEENEDKVGLTKDILAGATSLKFAVSNVPVGDIGIAITGGGSHNWDIADTQVLYKADEVYADNIISIPLAGTNSPQFMAEMRNNIQSNFALIFIYNGSDSEPQNIYDLGIGQMWLDFTPVMHETEPGTATDPDSGYVPDSEYEPEPDPDTPPSPGGASAPGQTPGQILKPTDGVSPWASVFMIATAVIALAVIILVIIKRRA